MAGERRRPLDRAYRAYLVRSWLNQTIAALPSFRASLSMLRLWRRPFRKSAS